MGSSADLTPQKKRQLLLLQSKKKTFSRPLIITIITSLAAKENLNVIDFMSDVIEIGNTFDCGWELNLT